MSSGDAPFSSVGDGYGAQLARGLQLTGESAAYFAQCRIARTYAITVERGTRADVVLDFGCGTGTSLPILREAFPRARIVGFEPEAGLRVLAESAARGARAEMLDTSTLGLDGEVDVVYCNGVFHHIPLQQRNAAMASIARALRPGGLAIVWENSPFNPGTRWVMSRIAFDRDARLLTPAELRALQRRAGLAPLASEFHFVFPRFLRALRFFEPALTRFPLGGQYVTVAARTANSDAA